jgi:hypothetical protein
MKRQHLRLLLPVLMFTAVAGALPAPKDFFQSDNAPHQAWDAGTRYPGFQAPSTLTLVNDCKKTHSFSVTKSNAGFLDFDFTSPVTVPGKSSVTKPVHFHTEGMQPGDYTGEVVVICLDCTEVPPCTQDHKYLSPHITVIPRPGATTENPVSTSHDDCQRDCNEILKRYNDLQEQVKAQQQIYSQANSDALSAYNEVRDSAKDAKQARDAGLANFDNKKSEALQKAAAAAQKDLQLAIDKYDAASKKANDALALLSDLKAQADRLFKDYQDCLATNGVCKEEGPPTKCTPDNPCTNGWNPCGPGQICTSPEKCTPDHPCTGGTSVTGPPQVTKGKSTCSQTKDDCEQLRLLAEQKEAEALAAQETANVAAAEATKQEALTTQTAGKDPRDVVAQIEIARSARENANTLQRAADNAKAAAEAARKLADDCYKHLKDDCPQIPGQNADGGNAGVPVTPTVTGNTPGTTSTPPCPPNPYNCEPYRLAWQEAERQAAIAQAVADQTARNQQWNQADADYYDSQAAKEEEFALGQTERAKAYRELAGGAKGLAMRDREIAARQPAGSKDQIAWEKAAVDDENDVISWNADAAAAEQTELQYHMKAAADKAKAAQLRASSNSAQANADAAKTAAAAAKKAYDDCVSAQKQYDEDCKRRAAEAARTRERPQTGGGTPTGGTNPGGTNPGTGGGTPTGGNTGGGTPVGIPPKIGTQGIPGYASSMVDNLQTVESPICHWKTWALPIGAKIADIYIRNAQSSLARNTNVEARLGKPVSVTGQATVEYHCLTDNGTAVVTFTYLINSESHIGRLMVSCSPD